MIILYYFYILSIISSFFNADSTNTSTKKINPFSDSFSLTSTKIRDNKLYALYKANEDTSVQLKVYELKEELIANIYSSGKTFNITNIYRGFNLVFFDTLDDLEKDSSKLWVKSERFSYERGYDQLDGNYIGYINLNNMSLNQELELLKFPAFDNFPVMGYAMSAITNAYGTSLYVTGGELYSKSEDKFLISDSFYKYNFTSKDWVDMKSVVRGKLNPLARHKSFVFDNRYFVVIGGVSPKSLEEVENSRINFRNKGKFNSVYDLQIFDTFTNSWENIKLNSTVAATSTSKIEFYDYLAKVYKGQILALGGKKSENLLKSGEINNNIGILDVKSKSWTWTPMVDESGFDTDSQNIYKDFQIFNDQIIMFSDYSRKTRTASILVYDLPSKRTKSTLRLSDVSKENDLTIEANEIQHKPKGLPVYAITLISLSCIVFALVLSYLIYRKYRNKTATKNNAPIHEVWSNTNTNISQKTILWDKSKGIYIDPNFSGAPGLCDTERCINTSFNSEVIEFNK